MTAMIIAGQAKLRTMRGAGQIPRGVRRTMEMNLPLGFGAPAAIARAPGS